MKTIAKLYKEYGGFLGMVAIFSLLGLVITSTLLILYVNSAKADAALPNDCIYYDEEKLDNGKKVCYYECAKGPQDLVISELSECPTNE